MALIGMAVYSTEENGKDEYLDKTLQSLYNTVDFKKHRLILSVNAFTNRTMNGIIRDYYEKGIIEKVIYNDSNIGTAEAINKVWKERRPGENAIKMDDDVVIHNNDWIGDMEEAIRRDPRIGQIGLKRRDCLESPSHPDPLFQSKLEMLPHKPGEKWIVVESVRHVMGTCVMHSSALLDKVGYLLQPKLYGFDDVFMSLRSKLAGFKNVFLSKVDIEHIDPGTTPFQKWKEEHAGSCWAKYDQFKRGFLDGSKPIYYNPFEVEVVKSI